MMIALIGVYVVPLALLSILTHTLPLFSVIGLNVTSYVRTQYLRSCVSADIPNPREINCQGLFIFSQVRFLLEPSCHVLLRVL